MLCEIQLAGHHSSTAANKNETIKKKAMEALKELLLLHQNSDNFM